MRTTVASYPTPPRPTRAVLAPGLSSLASSSSISGRMMKSMSRGKVKKEEGSGGGLIGATVDLRSVSHPGRASRASLRTIYVSIMLNGPAVCIGCDASNNVPELDARSIDVARHGLKSIVDCKIAVIGTDPCLTVPRDYISPDLQSKSHHTTSAAEVQLGRTSDACNVVGC